MLFFPAVLYTHHGVCAHEQTTSEALKTMRCLKRASPNNTYVSTNMGVMFSCDESV